MGERGVRSLTPAARPKPASSFSSLSFPSSTVSAATANTRSCRPTQQPGFPSSRATAARAVYPRSGSLPSLDDRPQIPKRSFSYTRNARKPRRPSPPPSRAGGGGGAPGPERPPRSPAAQGPRPDPRLVLGAAARPPPPRASPRPPPPPRRSRGAGAARLLLPQPHLGRRAGRRRGMGRPRAGAGAGAGA